jgi:phage head maturation protease
VTETISGYAAVFNTETVIAGLFRDASRLARSVTPSPATIFAHRVITTWINCSAASRQAFEAVNRRKGLATRITVNEKDPVR